ncbi:probable phosphatase 2C 72 [Olea europaea subsp. europaea]|uniref:Probable phosphatase 2C 72 n=1 Tax=Olea europaea subsp. europaea TaxID=158383 RepID=A0A8S0ULJ5_OLEEU|nr:probable phosphatase 2C 72 [Olea europaea subsp. europaea]
MVGTYVIANLGDSRAVLGTKTENGIKAVQLTTDFKPEVPESQISSSRLG